MRRREFLQALAGPAAMGPAGGKPNIIFILADDLWWGDLNCYGNRNLKTPGMDRLAKEGTLFTQFYVNGPVCSPSRAGFFTGRYPGRHGIHGHFATEELNRRRGMPNYLPEGTPNVARTLRAAGYATAHFGKWHLGNNGGAPLPGAYGFDVHRSVSSTDPQWVENAPGFRAQSSRVFVDWGLEFIREQKGRPFYLQLWMLVPHAPLAPTEAQLAPFAKTGPADTVPHKGAHQIYNASVADLDTQVGRLLAELDKMGLAGNTMVILSSDNGPEDIHIRNASHSAFGSPGPFRGRKRSLYEGGVRVPFLVRWPGRTPAGKVNATTAVSGVDLLPTLAAAAGVKVDDAVGLDGEEMLDVFVGTARSRKKPLFWEWRFQIAGYYANKSPILAMRDGDWKLLMNPDRSRVELYDIPRDPYELTNLAAREPKVVEKLARRMLSWQAELPKGPMDEGAGSLAYPMPR
jgi:arylsulfatase A-like enzyme